jgi:hypothetical protein
MSKIYLVERSVEVKNLTKDEFVTKMSEDITNAINIYQLMCDVYNKAAEVENTNRNLERFHNEAEKLFTEFKRESTRQQKREAYVNEKMAKYNHFYKLSGISYFDLDCEPGKNGLSGCCCISFKDMMDILPRTFEYLKDNKYFNGAIGWKLGYDESSFHKGFCSSRPQIYLTLPIELETQFNAEASKLAREITDFYRTARYFGD